MMDQKQIDALSALIGKRYKECANGPDEFDCAGLAVEVQKILGVRMDPLPLERRAEQLPAALTRSKEASNWRLVPDPAHGDLVVMANVLERYRHLGVYIIPTTAPAIIHIDERHGVILDDFPSVIARGFNVLTFYRRKNEDGASPSLGKRSRKSV